MRRVVFLLEERSMKVLIEGLLPRLFPEMAFLCVPHEGKNDLEKSIPRKLRAWREPGVRFVIVRDNDRGDCSDLKQRLVDLCRTAGRSDTLIRIAVQEIEAWYFGAPEALAKAFRRGDLQNIGKKAKYRNPDAINKPSAELEKLIPEFQKVSGARRIAEHLARTTNHSPSFNIFIEGVERIFSEMGEKHG